MSSQTLVWGNPALILGDSFLNTDFLKYFLDYGICGSPPISGCNISFDFRIKTNAVPRCVDPVIPNVDLETFQRPFGAERGLVSTSQFISQEDVSPVSSPGDSPRPSSPAMPAKV